MKALFFINFTIRLQNKYINFSGIILKMLCEDNLLSINDFEMQEKICKKDDWKYYEIVELKNGVKYLAKASSKDLKEFIRQKIVNLSREVNIFSKIY